MFDKAKLCGEAVLASVTAAENDAIHNGEVKWFLRKCKAPNVKYGTYIRVFCCQEDGTIDTEFVFNTYINADPRDPNRLRKLADATNIPLAEVRKYAKGCERISAWHIVTNGPLMSLGKPIVLNISDFGFDKLSASWERYPANVKEYPDGLSLRVSCDTGFPLGHEGSVFFIPAGKLDLNTEYVPVTEFFIQAPEGYTLIARKDALPYVGQNRWLVSLKDIQVIAT